MMIPRRPTGLCNWRYFWPWAVRSADLDAHRRLWLGARRNRPWLFWLAAQLIGWVNWLGWFAARRCEQVIQQELTQGRPMSNRERRALTRLAIGYAMPPGEIVEFAAHRTDRSDPLRLVFDIETSAYHRLRNRQTAEADAASALLSDKLASAAAMAKAGIAVVPNRQCVAARTSTTLAELMAGQQDAFFKARHGHAGAGSFAVECVVGGWAGRRHDGTELKDAREIQTATRQLLQTDDMLVQPLLRPHPLLAALGLPDAMPPPMSEGVPVLRYVSEQRSDDCLGFCAFLQIRAGNDQIIMPVDPDTGAITAWPVSSPHYQRAMATMDRCLARAPGLAGLPGWAAIREQSHRAHKLVPALWAVAWDWAIAADGPVLMEGNAQWGLSIPQMLRPDRHLLSELPTIRTASD